MKKNTQIFTYLFFVLVISTTSAQNDQPTFEDDVQDNPPAAPINDYLPDALLSAVALGWFFVRKTAHKKV